MIDEDFSPNRLQLRAIGHLLLFAQHFPTTPALIERELYQKVGVTEVDGERCRWLSELAENGLVKIVAASSMYTATLRHGKSYVALTPAGMFYAISRASLLASNARAPTDEFPDEIVDGAWAIQSYYSTFPDDADMAPSADAYVRFDHNQQAYSDAVEALVTVSTALRSDNVIGNKEPEVRDEKLLELNRIRALLEKREGWRSQLLAAAWATLGFLISEFAHRPVGYLADQAWKTIQMALGTI